MEPLERFQQSGGAAGEGQALREVGDQRGELVDVEHTVDVVVARDQANGTGRGERLEVVQEDRVGPGRGDVDDGDVEGRAPAGPQHALVGGREQVAKHADHRRDAGAGGDEEEAAALGGQHELAGCLLEVDEGAGPHVVDEVVADEPVGDRLDRDRDPAVGAGAMGQGVGAPLADAVDVDADPDVLPRDVTGPVGTGPDHERGRVAGLGSDLLDPAAQVGARAQGGEEVQEVGGYQRRRGRLDQSTRARSQGGLHGFYPV